MDVVVVVAVLVVLVEAVAVAGMIHAAMSTTRTT